MTKPNNVSYLTFVVILLALPMTTYAQQPAQVTGGFSIGIVGQGDRLIPSGHVGYHLALASSLDINGEVRFSRLSALNHDDPLRRGRLTYLDGSLGINVQPIQFGRHQLSFGLGAAMRGRWEYDAYLVRNRRRGGELVEQEVFFDRRRSVDVGARLKAMYSVRITPALRLGLYMEGYNYNEGTGLFFFGVQSAFLL